jgi:hypothetical protein
MGCCGEAPVKEFDNNEVVKGRGGKVLDPGVPKEKSMVTFGMPDVRGAND